MDMRSTPRLDLIEVSGGYVAPARRQITHGANPFVLCWGDHPGPCPLLEGRRHGPRSAHGIVVELDYDDGAHRMLLRWLRHAAERACDVVPVPRVPAETAHDTGRTHP